MAVGLVRYRDINDPETIDLSENVASARFYKEFWEPAIQERGVKIFQENGYFGKEQLDTVLAELSTLKDWAVRNLEGYDLEYMAGRIENLQNVIPEAFDRDGVILYIY